MTLRVLPLSDDVDQRSNWQVKKDGVGRKSHHTHKSAAIRKAKQLARDGETYIIYNTRGHVIDSRTRTRRR